VSYAQTLVDDFNDNSFNTTLWARTSSSTAVEASAKLTITPDPTTSQWLLTKLTYDLTNGNIFAFKCTKSGTAGSGTEVFFGASDSATPNAGNRASFGSTGATGTLSSDNQGSTTVSGYTNVGSPAGVTLTAWTAGTWYGIGSWASDNILHLYKSSDGQTWTELAHMTFGGTFCPRTAAHVFISAGDFSGTSGYTLAVDDASLFTPVTTHGKVRSGGAWVVPTNGKVRSGGAWVTPTATKVRSGGAWVTPTN
jgi:hypothetical protein